MDCSPPGFSLHGILRARILECVAISFSTESFWLRDQIHVFYVSCIGRRVLYQIVDKSIPLRAFHNMFRDTGLMLRIAWLRAHPLNPCPPTSTGRLFFPCANATPVTECWGWCSYPLNLRGPLWLSEHCLGQKRCSTHIPIHFFLNNSKQVPTHYATASLCVFILVVPSQEGLHMVGVWNVCIDCWHFWEDGLLHLRTPRVCSGAEAREQRVQSFREGLSSLMCFRRQPISDTLWSSMKANGAFPPSSWGRMSYLRRPSLSNKKRNHWVKLHGQPLRRVPLKAGWKAFPPSPGTDDLVLPQTPASPPA